MPLPEVLPIPPFPGPARGEVTLPGSKSLTNRAMLLAALANGKTLLTGALFSEDTEIMGEALRRLGFAVNADAGARTLAVEGRGGEIPAAEADIFVGLAGTAARFLTALCAAAPRGRYRLDGTPQMRQRPMRGLIDALRGLGADIRCEGADGFFPFTIHARGLRSGAVAIDASESSQMLSALLMIAPLTRAEPGAADGGGLRISLSAPVREPFVEMTLRMMREFGAEADAGAGGYRVPSHPYRLAARGTHIHPIEPDATAASYFLALPLAAGGALRLDQVRSNSLQGDIAFADVLRRVGLATREDASGLAAGFPDGAAPQGVTQNFQEFSDTFLTLAALSPLFEGPTRITGIAHTRKQETDRVEAMAAELRKIVGADRVRTTDDSLEVNPPPRSELRARHREPVRIETYGDHRVAMSFGILGCHDLHGDGRPWIAIHHPGVCAKTFPAFFDVLAGLRGLAAAGPKKL